MGRDRGEFSARRAGPLARFGERNVGGGAKPHIPAPLLDLIPKDPTPPAAVINFQEQIAAIAVTTRLSQSSTPFAVRRCSFPISPVLQVLELQPAPQPAPHSMPGLAWISRDDPGGGYGESHGIQYSRSGSLDRNGRAWTIVIRTSHPPLRPARRRRQGANAGPSPRPVVRTRTGSGEGRRRTRRAIGTAANMPLLRLDHARHRDLRSRRRTAALAITRTKPGQDRHLMTIAQTERHAWLVTCWLAAGDDGAGADRRRQPRPRRHQPASTVVRMARCARSDATTIIADRAVPSQAAARPTAMADNCP